mmetsp:Transcript_5654/g.13201  ORF Transcript_5654/g.13201 Transcript_5654/m.13201 type:complete len:110 (-) Transcript_5654:180-509(-)
MAFAKSNKDLFASVGADGSVRLFDLRVPSIPVAELNGHKGAVNSIAWAPHSACHIASASDDGKALIWDLSSIPKPVEGRWTVSLSPFPLFLLAFCASARPHTNTYTYSP